MEINTNRAFLWDIVSWGYKIISCRSLGIHQSSRIKLHSTRDLRAAPSCVIQELQDGPNQIKHVKFNCKWCHQCKSLIVPWSGPLFWLAEFLTLVLNTQRDNNSMCWIRFSWKWLRFDSYLIINVKTSFSVLISQHLNSPEPPLDPGFCLSLFKWAAELLCDEQYRVWMCWLG